MTAPSAERRNQPPRRVVAETVAEWEPGTFVENLTAGPGGSWLVTIPSHRRVGQVDRDGHTAVFAELDRMPTGIVADGTGRCTLARREIEFVAENLAIDDFAVHPHGAIFLATHHGNSVVELAPDGSRAELTGRDQDMAGSTAMALDPEAPDALYATTTGGMRGPHDRDGEPARLVRLQLNSDSTSQPMPVRYDQ